MQKLLIDFDFKNPLMPQPLSTTSTGYLVVGDLHGNFQKLLHWFCLIGALEMSPEYFALLVSNPKVHFNNFHKEVTVKETPIELLLLGDIFADRNPYDFEKAKLLYWCSNHGVKFEILLSNHDLAFFQYLEDGIMRCSPAHKEHITDYLVHMVDHLQKHHYKLVRLDDTNKLFFSHAPMSVLTWENLIGVYPTEDDFEELNRATISDVFNGVYPTVLQKAVWERKLDWGWTNSTSIIENQLSGYLHISGHDTYEPTEYNLSLDNLCGKIPKSNACTQEMVIFVEYNNDSGG